MKQKISVLLILILILQIVVPTINPLLDFVLTNNSIAIEYLGSWDISENHDKSVLAVLSSNGTLKISGTGTMKDFNTEDAPWWNYGYEDKIKEVIIEDGVEIIGSKAFKDLYNLTKVTIPETVQSIADNSFEGCKKLMEVHWYLSGNMFNYTPFKDLSPNVYLIWKIGENVTATISSKEKHIEISGIGRMWDGPYGWYYYYSGISEQIETAEISDGITNISGDLFTSCYNLKEITIPESVSYIKKDAFKDCSSLKEIKVPYNTTFEKGALDGCTADIIYVWNLSENIKAELNTTTGKLIIDGTGAIDDYHIFDGSKPNTPWAEFLYDISSVEIKKGITKIGNNTFYGCINLKDVSISNTVTIIGEQAFRKCESLSKITMPNSVTEIGSSAFYRMRELK